MDNEVALQFRQLEARCRQVFPPLLTDVNVRQTRKALLIVDDEPILTELLRVLVEGKGYTAITAYNGEEALSLYSTLGHSIAMVITDLDMPGIGGRQLINTLQQIDPSVRLLVITGGCVDLDVEGLLQGGVECVLRKPFSPRELFKQIQLAFGEAPQN